MKAYPHAIERNDEEVKMTDTPLEKWERQAKESVPRKMPTVFAGRIMSVLHAGRRRKETPLERWEREAKARGG